MRNDCELPVYRDDTTIIFVWKKNPTRKKKLFTTTTELLNISTKPLQLILKKRT